MSHSDQALCSDPIVLEALLPGYTAETSNYWLESMTHQQQQHETDDSDVAETRDVGSRLNEVHPVLHEPVKDFDECQDGEHGHKTDIELLTKDCHG